MLPFLSPPSSGARRALGFAVALGLAAAAACHVPAAKTPSTTPVAVAAASPALPAPPSAAAVGDVVPFVAAETLLAEAEPLWRARDELAALRGCIERFERALVQRPTDGALASRLGRAYFLLGYGHLRPLHDVPAMKQAFERGMLASEQALGETSAPFRAVMDGGGAIEDALVAVDVAGIDALSWYIGNLGGFAAAKGNTVALFYAERLRQGIERLLALDETYFYATPHRFMGIYLTKMPAFAGGSMRLAREHFERALSLAPNYFDNALSYAQMYGQAKHDVGLMHRLLGQVAQGSAAALPEVEPELRLQQAQARSLLAPAGQKPSAAANGGAP